MLHKEIRENGLVADLFTGPFAGSRKAIILLGGSEGGKSWGRVRKPLELLVELGYALLSLAYFKADGLPAALQEIPLEYFANAFSWLAAQEDIVTDQYALLGGSKGAEAALLLGSRYPQVKAIIAFSPSHVVWQGIPARRFALGQDVKSSWSYQGQGIPFLPYPHGVKKWELILLRLRRMHEEALQDTARVAEAVIPVEKVQGAILLFSGKRDGLWPAAFMGEQVVQRLAAGEFIHEYGHVVHDSGHNSLLMNKACWRTTFDFLQRNFS